MSTEFRRLSARRVSYPPPYAQLLHRSPDVTQRIPAMIAIRIHSVFSRRLSVNPEFPTVPLSCPVPLPPRPVPPPQAPRQPLPAVLRPGPRRHPRMPRKYDCPVSAIGLPWIHDLSSGAEAARIHESGTAAFGCPGRRSGCLVSASRHVPAAAPGKSPSGAVSFTSGRIDRPKSLSCRLDN